MKRKIIKQGYNTLTVTLPSKWSREHGIKPGTEIELDEKDNSLIIHTEKKATLSKIDLDVRGLPLPIMWRHVVSAYRSGYDEIQVNFDKPSKKTENYFLDFDYSTLRAVFPNGISKITPAEAIQTLVNRLIGVEIIDQRESYCIIKEMGETSFQEFNNSLRRMFLLILSMADETYTGYKSKNKETLKTINLIDTNVDRFEDFCLRVLNKRGYSKHKKTTTMYNLVFLLELAGDEYKKIAIHLIPMKTRVNPLILNEFERLQTQFRRFYNLFYKFSKETILEIYKVNEEADKFLDRTHSDFSDKEREIIHHLKKIGTYILCLTELRIDLEI